jgi:hypothetical protein
MAEAVEEAVNGAPVTRLVRSATTQLLKTAVRNQLSRPCPFRTTFSVL